MSIEQTLQIVQEEISQPSKTVGLVPSVGSSLGNTTGIVSANELQKKISGNKHKWKLKRYAEKIMPGTRQSYCMRFSGGNAVKLHYNHSIKNATYRNLAHCDNPWLCPVCSPKINARRRDEVLHTINNWHGPSILLTGTIAHTKHDDTREKVDQVRDAWRAIFKDRWGRDWKKTIGWAHSISHLDFTYGNNGWHPHIHAIVLLDPDKVASEVDLFDDDALQQYIKHTLAPKWIEYLQKFGGDANYENGFVVSTGDGWRRDYIAKFGHEPVQDRKETIAYEITHNNSKTLKGLTAFQVLELSEGKAKTKYGRAWQQYMHATKHRKQLTFSPGLKALVGLDDLTDEEIVEQHAQEDPEICEIPYITWEAILYFDKRAQLLNYCIKHEGALSKIEKWFARIDRQYGKYMRQKALDDAEDRKKWEIGTIWDKEGLSWQFDKRMDYDVPSSTN